MTKKNKGIKKDKKPKDTDSQALTAVDRTFYEITIQDLNNKLARLRAQNSKLEELNENLMEKFHKLDEDRIDITAFLDRQLTEKTNIIKEMDERLTELAKIRIKESEEAAQKLKEFEMKYKSMNEQLTSEIKLLNGKLNSLEEFRIQRDELLAKFDEQETALKEYARMHKNVVQDMEQKSILEKDQLKKEVQHQLLQLSSDFHKLTDVRIADYTRQLYKENLNLEKEMDKMIRAQVRFERKYKELENRNQELEKFFKNVEIEKKNLLKSSQNQIKIIEDLTMKCEQFKTSNLKLKRYKELYENFLKKDICEQFSYCDMNKKLKIMAQRIEMVKNDKIKLIAIHQRHENEIMKLRDTLKQIKTIVLNAIEIDQNDENLTITHRENLLHELKQILTSYVEDTSIVPYHPNKATSSVYRPGIVGLTPKSRSSLLELFKREARKIASAEFISHDLKMKTVSSDQITPSPRIMETENVFDINAPTSTTIVTSHQCTPTEEKKSIFISDAKITKLQKSISQEDSQDDDELLVDEDENQQQFNENEEEKAEDEDDEYTIQFIY